MKLSFDEIVELIHREMYVRNGVMLGEKAAAKAILQAEEAAQQGVQSDVCPSCGVDDWAYGDDTNTFEVCAMCGRRR